jgi:hypothetical protein
VPPSEIDVLEEYVPVTVATTAAEELDASAPTYFAVRLFAPKGTRMVFRVAVPIVAPPEVVRTTCTIPKTALAS